jgi:gamma-glutamylcyclotransferase (GGCT)/AIG2-like uncharacterized protein YtfP
MTASPLFVYGTLRDADILAAVLARPIAIAALRRAIAPGYCTVYFPNRVYPALVPAAEAAARGLLIEGLGVQDQMVLDVFEGEEYRRETIDVTVECTHLRADAYLPVLAIDPAAPEWSLEDWTARHKPAVMATERAAAARARRQNAKD